MKTIIVDDERASQTLLRDMLLEYCPEIRVVAMEGSVKTGLSAIQSHTPDLVFLDVELGSATGFDLLEKIGHANFAIVFTTAFEQYAIRAFKYSAADYLLKPIDADDLQKAVQRVHSRKQPPHNNDFIKNLLLNLQDTKPKRLTITALEEVLYIATSDIIRCEADRSYSYIFLSDGRKITATKPIGEFEELLPEENFVRTHHSYIVNLAHVKKFIKSEDALMMTDGAKVQVATRKKAEVLRRLEIF